MADEPFYPEIITNLPSAALPIDGVASHLLQGERQQFIFMSFDQDVEVSEHSHEAQWGVFHIAEESSDQRAVGFQTLEPYASYTHAFDHVAVVATFVDLGCRGRGVGRRLAEATFESARGMGYEKIFTLVRADNADALQFYLKIGFQVVGTAEKQARINGSYVDEVIIEKFL